MFTGKVLKYVNEDDDDEDNDDMTIRTMGTK